MKLQKRKGQTMIEFAIMAAMFLLVTITLIGFLAVFSEWGTRILRLVGLKYP
ncbi:MAG: hypothetical protein MK193_07270 [Lentisphaeria bacterium]|nr:hypothetical protein [Lentisphaeria bacterium]